MSPHQPQRQLDGEDAGVLGLVLLEDVGLDGAADDAEGVPPDARVDLRGQNLVAAHAEQHQAEAVVPLRKRALVAGTLRAALAMEGLDALLHLGGQPVPPDVELALLVDGGVEEEPEQHGRGPVDGHRHAGGRVGEVEARVELLGVVDRGHAHPGVAHLAKDVHALVGVLAVERDRVEGGGEAVGQAGAAEEVEAPVGALGAALAREHALGMLLQPPQREHGGRVRKCPRHVLGEPPAQDLAPSPGTGAAPPRGMRRPASDSV